MKRCGVPSIEPGKKGELWVQVELCPASRPADALAGSKAIAGWVPRDSLRLPSLLLEVQQVRRTAHCGGERRKSGGRGAGQADL